MITDFYIYILIPNSYFYLNILELNKTRNISIHYKKILFKTFFYIKFSELELKVLQFLIYLDFLIYHGSVPWLETPTVFRAAHS